MLFHLGTNLITVLHGFCEEKITRQMNLAEQKISTSQHNNGFLLNQHIYTSFCTSP